MSSAERPYGKDEGSTPDLDLGLSKILEQGPPNAQTSEALAEPIVMTAPLIEPPPAPKNEFEQLAEIASWAELCTLCETRIQEQGESDGEARLWWVKGQLELKAVPASILASLLDSASRHVQQQVREAVTSSAGLESHLQSLVVLACQLLRTLAAVLRDHGDQQLAVTFYDRAYRFDSQQAEMVLAAVASERSALESSKDYGRELEIAARLRDLKNLEAELASTVPPASATIQAGADVSSIPQPSSVPPSFQPASSSSISDEQRATSRLRSAVYALTLLVIVVVGLYALYPGIFSLDGEHDSAPQLVATERRAQPILPDPERSNKISQLDAVFYDLENKKPTQVTEPAARAPEVRAVVAEVREPPPPPREKEVVNTSYPLEDEMPKMAREESRQESRQESKRNPLFDKIEIPSRARGSGNRGVVGLEVEKYSGGKLFRVIARTRVLDRPNARSQKIATLERDDGILVESRVGDWLKLRSKNGYPGYIYAQDAEEDASARR